MRDTEPEDIPIWWGLGNRVLFKGLSFADDDGEVDMLEPGKTYPDWSFKGLDSCPQQEWERGNGSRVNLGEYQGRDPSKPISP